LSHTDLKSTLLWAPDHPVLQVLRERARTKSQPGMRTDTHKVGLAVEGGTMRGVVSCSMLAALSEAGFANAFDAVYGCSAGALNGAYFVAGSSWQALSVYYDDLASNQYIRLSRALVRRSVIDLGSIFQSVVDGAKPLNYEAVLQSPISLGVAITLVDEMKALITDQFSSTADLRSALMASSWHPVGVRGAAKYRGRRAVDGAVLTPLLFRAALEDGCTHVLSLSTYPMGAQKPQVSLFHRYTARHLHSLRKGLGDAYLSASAQKIQDLEWLDKARVTPYLDGCNVLNLAPLPDTAIVSRWEHSVARLLSAIRSSCELMYAVLRWESATTQLEGRIRAIPRWTAVQDDSRE
jgi:predicted patatin/cPLA2 family phospholipase